MSLLKSAGGGQFDSGGLVMQFNKKIYKMQVTVLITLVLTSRITGTRSDDEVHGAQYLQNTINGLKNNMEIEHGNLNVPITPLPIKRAYTPESQKGQPPPLHLTKAELAALYQSAIVKGETIKLDPDGGSQPIKAVVHELDSSASESKLKVQEKDKGYYYYYYPLKSFMDELSSSGFQHEQMKYDYHHKPVHHEDDKPHMHSHTHQHNVQIQPVKNMVDSDKKSKGLEPLFMAISGFIGMTIMFILSILVLPKFNKLKPKGFKNDGEEITSILSVAMQAIEGRNCAERISCEAGKAAKAFNLYDNRFVKLVRRFSPDSVGKQLDKVGKYMDKKYKCAAIQCKRKGGPGQAAAAAKSKVLPKKPKI